MPWPRKRELPDRRADPTVCVSIHTGLILTNTLLCVAVMNYNALLVRTDLDPSFFSGPTRSPDCL